MILGMLAALAAAATAFVMAPVFGEATAATTSSSPFVRTLLRLLEKRDQLLVALAELDFERDAGKIAEGEHRASRVQILAEAASVTEELDALGWREDAEDENEPENEAS